jgi:DNA-binding NarL/FixJ family response regulator
MNDNDKLLKSIDETGKILRYILVIELYKQGVKQIDICKQLKLSTKTVNDMLKIIPKNER